MDAIGSSLARAVPLASPNLRTPAPAQVAPPASRVAGESSPRVAGERTDARTLSQDRQEAVGTSLQAQLRLIQAQIAERTRQAGDVQALNFNYSKSDAALTVKVMQAQTGEQVRELVFRDYQAMALSNRGQKGRNVDLMA